MFAQANEPVPKLRINPATLDLLLVLTVPLAIYLIELQAGLVSQLVDAFDAISVFGIHGDEVLVILSSLGFMLLFYSMRRQRETTRSRLALQQSERRFRALIENSADGIVLLDPTGQVLYRSPAGARMLGRPTGDAAANVFDVVHPDDLADFQSAVGRILRQPGANISLEYRARHQDGSWRWLDAIATNLLSDQAVGAVVANYRDITQRKQSAEALQKSEQRLQLTMDSMLEGAQIIDHDWRYLYVNGTAAAQGRQPREALLGHQMMDAYPGIEQTPLFAALQRSIRENAAVRMENQVTYAGQASEWFDLSIQPVPEGVFILSHDISERVRAREAIQTQLDHIRALRAIDLAIMATTDRRIVLDIILEQVLSQLHVTAATVLLLDEYSHTLTPVAGLGFRQGWSALPSFQLGQGIAGQAALERRNFSVFGAELALEQFKPQKSMESEQFQSVTATPLITKGRVIGVLEVFCHEVFNPDAEWMEFLETLAGQTAIAIDNVDLFANLQRSNLDLARAYDATIEGWSRALDLRDRETEGHTLRVTALTMDLAARLGFSAGELVHIRRGALLHDIGKMGVPDNILHKPGPLTDEEWVIMRKHPVSAFELLSPIAYLGPALDIPYCHHEQWDGSGYPRRLTGEQIPLSARLFAVIDVWDALCSDRPYRAAWPEEKVRAHIRSLSGAHFDPRVVEVFLSMQA